MAPTILHAVDEPTHLRLQLIQHAKFGSTETALQHTAVLSLALLHHRRQMQFVLMDLKGRAFEPLTGLPHLLCPIVTKPDQAVQVLSGLVTLMEQRDRSRVTDPRVIVAIDELADLVHTGGPAIVECLARLVQRGRGAGIHVIGATQKPSSSIIGPLVKANFPVRLVGRVMSADDARVAAGVGGTGAEKLTGRGDFVAVCGPGLIRFQAAYVSVIEIEATVQQLAQGIRGDEIIQSGRPMTTRSASRANHSTSVLDSAVFALPGIER